MMEENTSLTADRANTQPAKQVWGAWSTLGFGLVIGMVFGLAQTFVAVIFIILKLVAEPTLDLLELTESLMSDGLLISLCTVASAIAGLGLTIIIIKVRRGLTIPEYLGLRRISAKQILVLLVISAGFILLANGLTWILDQPPSSFTIDTYRTSVWPVLFWIAAVIFAPLFEEAFFRGFLFVGLSQSRIGVAGTIGLTALIWAVMHVQYGVFEIGTIFILGLVLGIARHQTGSLWSPLLMHAIFNLTAMVQTALYINGVSS